MSDKKWKVGEFSIHHKFAIMGGWRRQVAVVLSATSVQPEASRCGGLRPSE